MDDLRAVEAAYASSESCLGVSGGRGRQARGRDGGA